MKMLGINVSVEFHAESFHILPILSVSTEHNGSFGVAFGWFFWTGYAAAHEEPI
jgi:hypothetical protein